MPPTQVSSISSRALLASNPVERREGLRIPTEIVALSVKPNSLLFPKRTSPAWADSPSPNRLSPQPESSPIITFGCGRSPRWVPSVANSSPHKQPHPPILQHPHPGGPTLAPTPHDINTHHHNAYTHAPNPTFFATPHTRRKTPRYSHTTPRTHPPRNFPKCSISVLTYNDKYVYL